MAATNGRGCANLVSKFTGGRDVRLFARQGAARSPIAIGHSRAPCNTCGVQARRNVTSGSPFESSIGFSRAVRVGDRVLVSGTGPIWPDGSCPADPGEQARRCFEIISTALGDAGTDLSAVVRTRMYLTDPAAADAVSAVHGQLFEDVRPAATMVIVAGLLDTRWKVEIEAEALIASSAP